MHQPATTLEADGLWSLLDNWPDADELETIVLPYCHTHLTRLWQETGRGADGHRLGRLLQRQGLLQENQEAVTSALSVLPFRAESDRSIDIETEHSYWPGRLYTRHRWVWQYNFSALLLWEIEGLTYTLLPRTSKDPMTGMTGLLWPLDGEPSVASTRQVLATYFPNGRWTAQHAQEHSCVPPPIAVPLGDYLHRALWERRGEHQPNRWLTTLGVLEIVHRFSGHMPGDSSLPYLSTDLLGVRLSQQQQQRRTLRHEHGRSPSVIISEDALQSVGYAQRQMSIPGFSGYTEESSELILKLNAHGWHFVRKVLWSHTHQGLALS
ncbi:MAG: hypothetical protein AAFS10_16060 [Myxococcota bacterium]